MADQRISIKDAEVMKSLLLNTFDSILVTVLLSIIDAGYSIFITEGWRKKRHPNDLHGINPARAIDLRSWMYPDGGKELETWINKAWAYDPQRPEKQVALIHDAGGGVHFHIQVHPNTKPRVKL